MNIIFCALSKRSILIPLLQNSLPPILQSSSFQSKLLVICSWINIEQYFCSSLLPGKLTNQVHCLEFWPLKRFLFNTVLHSHTEWSYSAAGIQFQLLPVFLLLIWNERLKRGVSLENNSGGRGKNFEEKRELLSTMENWGKKRDI